MLAFETRSFLTQGYYSEGYYYYYQLSYDSFLNDPDNQQRKAPSEGGGVYVSEFGTGNIQNCDFDGNVAPTGSNIQVFGAVFGGCDLPPETVYGSISCLTAAPSATPVDAPTAAPSATPVVAPTAAPTAAGQVSETVTVTITLAGIDAANFTEEAMAELTKALQDEYSDVENVEVVPYNAVSVTFLVDVPTSMQEDLGWLEQAFLALLDEDIPEGTLFTVGFAAASRMRQRRLQAGTIDTAIMFPLTAGNVANSEQLAAYMTETPNIDQILAGAINGVDGVTCTGVSDIASAHEVVVTQKITASSPEEVATRSAAAAAAAPSGSEITNTIEAALPGVSVTITTETSTSYPVGFRISGNHLGYPV